MVKKRNFKRSVANVWSRVRSRWPALSYSALPLIVLAGFSITGVVGYVYVSANLNQSRTLSTRQQFKDNFQRISIELDAYANLLRGGAAEMQGGSGTEGAWSDFIAVYKLRKNFPALEAIAVSKGTALQETTYAYITPLTVYTKQLIGVNPAQNPTVKTAMEESLQTDSTTLAGPIHNVLTTKNIKGAPAGVNGFYLVKPYYNNEMPHDTYEQRSNALRGFTIAMFRGDVFFNEIYKNIDLNNKGLAVYLDDPVPENLMYDSDRTSEASKTTNEQRITLYGRTITIVYTQDTSKIVPFSETYLPEYLLFIGLSLGVFVSLLSGYMLRNRYRMLMTQKERDVNFAKDELLSLASHQLRTPATGVKQYLGMVLQGFSGDISEQQRKYLEQAYRSNNRQLHIINDILHLAKLESGRIVLAEHKFDFAIMIREVVDEQQSDADNGGISLKLTAPSKGLMIGDSHMLRMVVENLVSNGIKYTPSGGVVSIRLVRRGAHWVLMVKDTGVGIAKNDLKKLFKQFSRIVNPRSDFVTGTGIGLYLAHHLVVLHGGTISVSSDEGKGSTFVVRLPRKM